MLSLAAMRATPMKSRKIEPQIGADQFSDEEIARRYEATLKRVLATPPKHRTTKGEKENPPKTRGRPKNMPSAK
jgi:hypothetical protein